MATYSSIFAWEIPWTEEPERLCGPTGPQRVRHEWATEHYCWNHSSFIIRESGASVRGDMKMELVAGIVGLWVDESGQPLLSRSVVSNSLRPHGVVLQAPLSVGFSGQEYRSGLPFPPPSGQPLETGKVREPFLSKSPEGWFLAPVRLIGDFWPPELWMILSFLKPPRVWQSVAAAIGNESEHSQQVHQLVVIVSQSRKKRSGKGLPPPTQDGTAGLPGFLNPQSWVSLESTSAGKQGGQRLMEPKALTCVVSTNTPRASNTQFLLGPPEPRL